LTFSISPRIRATSRRPSSWISAGVMSVVVKERTSNSYHCAPPGNAPKPEVLRAAGR